MLNKEEIIKTVAEKHKIFISEDDPILTVFAVNDAIFQETQKFAGSLFQKEADRFSVVSQANLKNQLALLKNERENSLNYYLQIVRDSQNRFERRVDDVAETIKSFHFETIKSRDIARKAMWTTLGLSFLNAIVVLILLLKT